MLKLEKLYQSNTTSHGATVASVLVEGPNPHFRNHAPWSSVGRCILSISLDIHAAGGWVLDCFVDLPDMSRTQWSVVRRYYDRDKAGQEAAVFFAHALKMQQRSLEGHAVVTPGQKREAAAEQAWLATDIHEELSREVDGLAKAVRKVVDTNDHADWASVRALHAAACDRLVGERSRFVRAFHDDHHWSEFVDDVPDTERSAHRGKRRRRQSGARRAH